MKKARIVSGKVVARDWDGSIKVQELLLRAGGRGTGRVLHSATYWPWSAKSVEEAHRLLHEAAAQRGYKVISGPEE